MASPGGGTTTLGGGTAVSGSGTPDTGCGTPFRPVPAEFNHWGEHIYPELIGEFGDCCKLT